MLLKQVLLKSLQISLDKKPVLDSLFHKVAGSQACNFTKKRLQQQYTIGLLSALSALSPQNFSLKKFLILFSKKVCFFKKVFLVFRERYIQNSDIYRTRSIFRALPNINDRTFCKNNYLAHFSASVKIFSQKKLLQFRKELARPSYFLITIEREEFCSVHMKGLLFRSLFLKKNIQRPKALFKKRLYQRCFTMNFIKF